MLPYFSDITKECIKFKLNLEQAIFSKRSQYIRYICHNTAIAFIKKDLKDDLGSPLNISHNKRYLFTNCIEIRNSIQQYCLLFKRENLLIFFYKVFRHKT